MVNRNGIPQYQPPKLVRTERCINKRNGKPKHTFRSKFQAERFIADVISPERRDSLEAYECENHWHLTTKRNG